MQKLRQLAANAPMWATIPCPRRITRLATQCLLILLTFSFHLSSFISSPAQNFPWGNADSANNRNNTHNNSGADQPTHIAQPNTSHTLINSPTTLPTQDAFTPTPAQQPGTRPIPTHKPGMHPFHIANLGRKLNWDSLYNIKLKKHPLPANCELGDWVVYGFHPNWMGTAWKSYNFKLLSHVSYFCYQVNLATGAPSDIGDWSTTPMIDSAKAAGCKVHLCVTTVGSKGHSRDMLNNPTIAQTCIDSLCALVKQRKADGVCIDFEDMTSADTLAFVNWVKDLKTALQKDNPKAEIAVAGYASGQSKSFSLPTLDKLVDYMVIMGYDYWGSWSKTAGCTAPLPGPVSGLNLEMTVDQYLQEGIAAQRLVLALPYYGDEWATVGDDNKNNAVISYSEAITYRQLMQSMVQSYVYNWDSNSSSSYYVKPSGSNYLQAWVIDSLSMAKRFDMVKDKKIAGIGIWALGYDNGQTQFWDLIHAKFGGCDPNKTTPTPTGPFIDKSPEWQKKTRWTLPWICIAALLILAVILLVDRKAREEVMNRYLLFPLAAMVVMTLLIVVFEMVNDYLCCLSASFPWMIIIGTAILALGFYVGRLWTEKKHHDR